MSYRLPVLASLVLLSGMAPSAPLPAPRDRSKADLKAMQGEWKAITTTGWLVTGRSGGVRLEIPGMTLIVAGDRITFSQDGKCVEQRVFRLDGSRRPGWINSDPPWADPMGARGRWIWAGIYKLEGDTLTICDAPSGARPTDFSGGRVGQQLRILKRVKK